MRALYSFTAALPLALLAACGQSDTAPGPGGVTVSEARALDEAAEMIEARRLPAEALETPPPADTEPPVRHAPPAAGQ